MNNYHNLILKLVFSIPPPLKIDADVKNRPARTDLLLDRGVGWGQRIIIEHLSHIFGNLGFWDFLILDFAFFCFRRKHKIMAYWVSPQISARGFNFLMCFASVRSLCLLYTLDKLSSWIIINFRYFDQTVISAIGKRIVVLPDPGRPRIIMSNRSSPLCAQTK